MFVPSLIPVYCVLIVLPTFSVRISNLDFLSRFLIYISSKRLKAADALLHPWFVSGMDEVPKVDCSRGVSADNYVENGAPLPQVKFSYEWGRKSIGECLSEVLSATIRHPGIMVL